MGVGGVRCMCLTHVTTFARSHTVCVHFSYNLISNDTAGMYLQYCKTHAKYENGLHILKMV